MTFPVVGNNALSQETFTTQEQNPSDFGGIFHAILLSDPESDPYDLAEELISREEIEETVFQLSSIDEYQELNREFIVFLNQQNVESKKQREFFLKVLFMIYMYALNASPLRNELYYFYKNIDSFSSLVQPHTIKQMHRQFRRIDVGKKREYLAQIQTLRPFLDKLYCKKLRMLALQLTILGEIDKSFLRKLVPFLKAVQDQQEWILGASEYNPHLFVSPSAQPEEQENSVPEIFSLHASQLLEASGELFLEKFVPQDFEAAIDGHTRAIHFWDQAFANEDFDWMDLVWALVSEFSEEEKDTLLAQLSGHQETLFSCMDLDESIREPVQNIEKAYMRQLCKVALHAKMATLALTSLESLRRCLREKQ